MSSRRLGSRSGSMLMRRNPPVVMMKQSLVGKLAGLCLFAVQLACADDYSAQREAVLALGDLTAQPAWQDEVDEAGEKGLRAIYADTVLANSLLRSMPEVDAEKVGLMGISWGGVITSTVIGIDGRFAFAIPNFPLDSQAARYRSAPGPHMVALIPGMRHGHGAGWRPPDSYAFAESVVQTGAPWCRQREAKQDGDLVRVSFSSAKPVEKAFLVSTPDPGFTGDRRWARAPADLHVDQDGVTVEAKLPPGTTAWFVNLHCGELTASSDFFETAVPIGAPNVLL